MGDGYVLSRSEIMDRIEVREPYFALRNSTIASSGEVHATVPVEQALGFESLPLTAAEAGRHLAILGSVAAAFANPKEDKHYYLAHKATLQRQMNAVPARSASGVLTARASGELTGKRSAVAKTILFGGSGDPIYTLDVEYHVLSEFVFSKLYSNRRIELRSEPREPRPQDTEDQAKYAAMRLNAYTGGLPHYDIDMCDTSVTASLGKITPRYCSGHFPLYPALPIAFLMSSFSSLTGHLLRYRLQEKGLFSYVVSQSDIEAEHLAFCGDEVVIHSKFIQSDGVDHRFEAEALANDEKSVGRASFTLTEIDG